MNRLKQLRKQKKLTQEELAVIARVSSKTIRRVEGGEYNFGVESAKRLAGFFGVSIDYLLGLDISKNRRPSAYRKNQRLDYQSRIR
nr:MAG: helix-turn-helix domain protein [Bacteriophage sp.]